MVDYLGIDEGDLEIAFSSVAALSKSVLQNEDRAKSWYGLPAITPKVESGEKGILLAVADGMGGQGPKGAGRRASEITINTLANYYHTRFPKTCSNQNILENLLVSAHHNIQKEGIAIPEKYKDMGSTAAVALVLKREDSKESGYGDLYDIHIANVGDSRIYYAKKSLDLSNPLHPLVSYSLEQLSIDDTVKGDITKNTLLQSLGMNSRILVHYNYAAKASSGDYLILCTDGVYKPMRMPEETILDIIKDCPEPRFIIDRLKRIHATNEKKDDFGVVVAQIA